MRRNAAAAHCEALTTDDFSSLLSNRLRVLLSCGGVIRIKNVNNATICQHLSSSGSVTAGGSGGIRQLHLAETSEGLPKPSADEVLAPNIGEWRRTRPRGQARHH